MFSGVRLQLYSEEVKLKTAELGRLEETVAELQLQLSKHKQCLRFVCCL